MNMLIRQKKAPHNSVAPLKIIMEQLFELDIDDDIWLDVGIGYNDEEEMAPPLWLSNEKVRAGIRAITDQDRCHEEKKRLLQERNAMQIWFSEEWRLINETLQKGNSIDYVHYKVSLTEVDLDVAIQYQLNLRKTRLCCIFVTWERSLAGVPFSDGLPEWGPTEDEVMEYRTRYVLGGGMEIVDEGGDEYDVDFEGDADGLLVEQLDSLRISENYRERQNLALNL